MFKFTFTIVFNYLGVDEVIYGLEKLSSASKVCPCLTSLSVNDATIALAYIDVVLLLLPMFSIKDGAADVFASVCCMAWREIAKLTYTVLVETLNPAQSINQSIRLMR